MAYFFLLERGPRPGLQLSVSTGAPLVLGRGSKADLPLPAEDRSISRRHAEVMADASSVQIKPLPNSGLTLVNGVPIARSTSLSSGDTVQVGETLLRLFTDDSPSQEHAEEAEPLSLRDIVQSIRSRRSEPWRAGGRVVAPGETASGSVFVAGAVFVEPDAERLHCTGCGETGIEPPRPDLWDAAWLCAQCTRDRRQNLPGMPRRLGNYDVLRPLAQGGMGVVYEGVARDNGLHVAIKVLRLARGAAERVVKRFAREQQITMALRHPNIVCCYDVGTWEGALYIASEFVSGGDALAISSTTSPLQQVLWLGADLFRALGYGHDLGIVHRDVKPANLLLCPIGPGATLRGKLADFGLAKSSAGIGGAITMSNESGGSLLTIGPEQLEDFVNIGPSADLYAGAATLFWMLTGDTPLVLPTSTNAASFEQKAQAIIDPRRKLVRDLRPEVPEQVAALVDGLVAHDPSMRAGMHAREVAVALNAIAARFGRRKPKGEGQQAPALDAEPASVHFKDALETVEVCVRMLEGSAERAARAVREAVASEDAARVDCAVADHEAAQADLENALSRWEKLIEVAG
jgi:eukaryotic-like serine/threonine-protein kinase